MSQVQNGTKEMLPDKRTYTVEEVPTERQAFQSYISGYRQNLRIHSCQRGAFQNRANRKRHTHFKAVI